MFDSIPTGTYYIGAYADMNNTENEVDEIWITFPDPQIKKRRGKKRLTHPVFLNRYKM